MNAIFRSFDSSTITELCKPFSDVNLPSEGTPRALQDWKITLQDLGCEDTLCVDLTFPNSEAAVNARSAVARAVNSMDIRVLAERQDTED